MTQMMERLNFVTGNVCDRVDRVEKHGNEAGTSTQEVRKVRAKPKVNNVSRAERPKVG
jgi:hypothetical protein